MDQNQIVSDNGSANIDDGANKSRGTCAKICIGWEKLKMEMGVVVMSNQRAGRMTSSEHAGATTLTTLRLSHSLKMFFGCTR